MTTAAAGPDRIWLGTGDTWEINVYALDATLTRIVRFDRSLAPVTDALMDAYLAELLEDADDDEEARSIRSRIRDMPARDQVPPYQQFVVDALGNAWIGEYVLPGAHDAARHRARLRTRLDARRAGCGAVDALAVASARELRCSGAQVRSDP